MKTRGKRFLFAGALAALYLYSFPYFPGIRSANELPRIYLTMAMVDEGSFAIDSGVDRWGATADVSPSGGHLYSNKAPGSSFLAVPSYLTLKAVKGVLGTEPSLAELTWTFRVATGVIPTLLFLLLLWRFLGRFCASPTTRRLVLAGYALGSMAMTYSVLFIAHQLAAICIATAYILSVWVTEEGLRMRWLAVAGLAAGAAPLIDYQAAFAGVPVAIFLLWKLLRRPPRRWAGVALAILGAIGPVALLLFYHWKAFGSPLRTGYDASETFAHFHQQGFLGMDRLRWDAFVGSTVAPDNGIFFLCPMLLIAVPGWWVLWRRRQTAHLAVTLSVAIIYLLFIASLSFWRGGWQMGPRYITAMLPFLLVPIGAAAGFAERRWQLRAVIVALIGASVAVYSLSCAVFPHFPEKFANPLYEVTFRLMGDGYAPYNAGWLLGLSGAFSLIPYVAGVLAVLIWVAIPSRRELRSGAVGLAAAAVLIGLYSLAPDGGPTAERAYQWITTVMPR